VSRARAALASIRSRTLSCDYQIPKLPSGMLDYGLVNVRITVGAGTPTLVPQAPSKSDCGPQGGWFYDDPAHPTRITLCPASCDPLLATPGSRLDVLIGCKTIPIVR